MATGIIGRRNGGHRWSGRKSGAGAPARATPIRALAVAVSGSVLTVTFDQAVALKGVPQYATNLAGVKPVGAVLTDPVTLALTFDAAVATANAVTIPFEDPGIRNASGGYVMATEFSLP